MEVPGLDLDVYFGSEAAPPPDWRSVLPGDEPDDERPTEEESAAAAAALGFDPRSLWGGAGGEVSGKGIKGEGDSYFGSCERDEEGHCLPSGEAGGDAPPDAAGEKQPGPQKEKIGGELRERGFNAVDLDQLEPEVAAAVTSHLVAAKEQFPGIEKALSVVKTGRLKPGVPAALVEEGGERRLVLDPSQLSGPGLKKTEGAIRKAQKRGWLAGEGVGAIIAHEVAHLISRAPYQLAMDNGWSRKVAAARLYIKKNPPTRKDLSGYAVEEGPHQQEEAFAEAFAAFATKKDGLTRWQEGFNRALRGEAGPAKAFKSFSLRPFAGGKLLPRTRLKEICKQGQTAASTGCTPRGGKPSQKPDRPLPPKVGAVSVDASPVLERAREVLREKPRDRAALRAAVAELARLPAADLRALREEVYLGGPPGQEPFAARMIDAALERAKARSPLAARFKMPVANPDARDTRDAYRRPDGSWTPERAALHKEIKSRMFAGKTPVKDPVAYVMGGGPAAGKSSTIARIGVPENTVTVAPDEIKKELPEYEPGQADSAPFVHEESSAVGKEVQLAASRGGYNTLQDGTGDGGIEKLTAWLGKMRAAGQRVVGHYVTVDTGEALRRAKKRAEETGRYIPESVLRAVHGAVSRVVPEAIRRGLYDEFTLWDTTGEEPVKVAEARGSELTVVDEALWGKFLAKADEGGEGGKAMEQPARPLTGDEAVRVALDLVLGREPSVTGEAADELRAELEGELEAARESGRSVELPFDLTEETTDREESDAG